MKTSLAIFMRRLGEISFKHMPFYTDSSCFKLLTDKESVMMLSSKKVKYGNRNIENKQERGYET